MAYCGVCDYSRQPPRDPVNEARDAPYSPRPGVACIECGEPDSASEGVPICLACIDKYHPGR